MKSLYLCLITLILALDIACSQSPPQTLEEWKATIKVVDEQGEAVPDARVELRYYVSPLPGQTEASRKIIGQTDTNGTFVASQADTRSVTISCRVTKTGYYATTQGHELGVQYDFARWNPTLILVLKKIGTPTAMYAKWIRGIPVFNQAVGYDLTKGDWVAPFGKGISADILFKQLHTEKSAQEYDDSILVTFPNKGDGIQEFPSEKDHGRSDLRSPHEAPETGYEPQIRREHSSRPPNRPSFEFDVSRNYFLRVRTELDERGQVKSAFFGKIYGDFMDFHYYLNPVPNSRNLEFNPAENLIKGLKGSQQVIWP